MPQGTQELGPNQSRLPSVTDRRIPSHPRCFYLLLCEYHCDPFFVGIYICRVPELLNVDGRVVPGPHTRPGMKLTLQIFGKPLLDTFFLGGSVLAARVTRVQRSGGGGGGGVQRQPLGHRPGGGRGGDGRLLGSWRQPSPVFVFPQRSHPCFVLSFLTSPSACYATSGCVNEGEKIPKKEFSDLEFSCQEPIRVGSLDKLGFKRPPPPNNCQERKKRRVEGSLFHR